MKLSWSDKEKFYHEVAQYTKSGIGIQEALQSIAEAGDSFTARRLAKRLLKASAGGDDLYTVFAHQGGAFSELELALLESGERSGRLEQVFKYLARYFHDLQEARSEVVRRSVYPVFLLHFAVFILPIANLVKGGFSTENIIRYLFQVLGTLFLFYGLAILLITIVIGLLQISRSVAGSDALTRIIPLIGKVRTFASVSRFCMALEMQIQAGVPMLQALPVAGRASQSGLILNRAERAVAKIDAGSTLADALGAPGPLPANVLRGLRLGQEAGTLDEELSRWGQFYLDQALTRIRVLADWLPKIIYFLIIGYVAYRIITTFAGTMQDMSKMIESAG